MLRVLALSKINVVWQPAAICFLHAFVPRLVQSRHRFEKRTLQENVFELKIGAASEKFDILSNDKLFHSLQYSEASLLQ